MSTSGQLSHLLHHYKKDLDAKASVVLAVILANPDFNRPAQINQSQNGDNIFNKLADDPTSEGNVIAKIGALAASARADALLLELGADHPRSAKLAAAILDSMAKAGRELDLPPALVVSKTKFFEDNFAVLSIGDVISHLSKDDEILQLLASQDFSLERCGLYIAALEISSRTAKPTFLAALRRGISELTQGDWEKAITATNGSHFDLLNLTAALAERDSRFRLSTRARDALRVQINKAGRNEIKISEQTRKAIGTIFQTLEDGLQASLVRDIIDDMMAKADSSVPKVVELFGDQIPASSLRSPDQTVRRLFNHIVANPSEQSLDWILRMIEEEPRLIKNLPEVDRTEFETRLKQSHTAASQSDDTRQRLSRICEAYGVELPEATQDDADSTS